MPVFKEEDKFEFTPLDNAYEWGRFTSRQCFRDPRPMKEGLSLNPYNPDTLRGLFEAWELGFRDEWAWQEGVPIPNY